MTSRFVARSPMPVAADALYDWHLRPGALERLTPPWEDVRVVERSGPLGEGATVTLRMGLAGPLALTWVARHESFAPGRSFVDVQQRGPFASWRHTHRMLPDGEGRSLLEDEIDYALPLAPLGALVGGPPTSSRLRRGFTFRHLRAAADLARHARFADRPRSTVAISGASGLVGSQLSAFLGGGGHRVLRLVRRRPRDADEIHWDPAAGEIDAAALEGVDAMVHLAGENIAGGRWTDERKRRIVASRVDGTRLVASALAGLERPPSVLVSASAVGLYGDRGDEPVDEGSAPGEGFLAETCRAWEDAVEPALEAGIRVVQPRLGLVLTPAGGALRPMLPPFLAGAGGPIGSGRQYMPWIAIDDLVELIHRALHDEAFVGPINAVAPGAPRNRAFVRTLGRVLHRPAVVPLPAPVVELLFGEMGRALLLAGADVRPAALERLGFEFGTPRLESALRFLLGRHESPPPSIELVET